MSYAAGRVINDADSHIMESLDWLSSYADPASGHGIAPNCAAPPSPSPLAGEGVREADG